MGLVPPAAATAGLSAAAAFTPSPFPLPLTPSPCHDRRSYKVKAKTATTRIEAGPLTAELWPHTRNWTFHDSRLNLTVQFVHSGALFLRDHMGIQTLTHPAFAPELDRLGLSAGAPAQRRPHMAVFGTTFHDDVQLGGPCADASKNSCGCAAEPAGDPSSKHFPQNLTWPQRMQRYRYHAAGAARLVTGLQAAGTRVVHVSLFPRYAGVDEFIRAAADEMLFSELKAAGFFSAGGRYMDQWPIYTGYFELSREHRADFGPSSLHYSQLSVRDRMMTNDLSLARLTLLLNGWCTSAAEASSPCGVGSQFLPLAGYVQELDATCSCGPFGMSITTPKLCQSDEASLADANGTAPHRVRKHPLPPYSKWQNAPAAEGTANDWSPFKRADAILTGAVLDPEWPGREGPYHGGRPWFVPEGGVDPEPYRVDATAEGIGQAAACGHPV